MDKTYINDFLKENQTQTKIDESSRARKSSKHTSENHIKEKGLG
jgi:hypothetical protein